MGNTYYHPDKAVERWAHMRENTHVTFRWTPRTIGYGLLWVVAVPVALYYAGIAEFVRGHASARAHAPVRKHVIATPH
jgi:hypothetical protein